MIPIVRSVIAVSNQLFQSIPDLFLFSSLICISPPYVYIISYGVPYVKRFLREYAKKCLLSGTFRISERKKLFDYSQQRQHRRYKRRAFPAFRRRSEHLGSNQSLQPVKLYVFPLNYIPSAATKRIGGFFRTSGDMRLSVLAFYL